MEGITILIALCVVVWLCCGKSKPAEQVKTNHRAIRKVGIFNRYEVTIKGYYGLCGTTKKEVDVCIGIATFDSHRFCIDGAGTEIPSDKNYNNFIVPSNYKLIKEDFIKQDEE